MIFRRDKKRRADPELEEDSVEDEPLAASADDPVDPEAAAEGGEPLDVDALDDADWRLDGPWDIAEVDELNGGDDGPKIDLGAMILTGVPGSELRLQVAEDTQQIVSAMLVIETPDESAPIGGQTVTSALELGAYAAPRSGGFWAELRDEISASAIEVGGSAELQSGPFGVELFRLFPVTTPDGDEGYQPSKMWVAEGPRWLLRGIVYGQAAIEQSDESVAVSTVAAAFRKVVVRRGDEAMAPGDLLPLNMPADLVSDEERTSNHPANQTDSAEGPTAGS